MQKLDTSYFLRTSVIRVNNYSTGLGFRALRTRVYGHLKSPQIAQTSPCVDWTEVPAAAEGQVWYSRGSKIAPETSVRVPEYLCWCFKNYFKVLNHQGTVSLWCSGEEIKFPSLKHLLSYMFCSLSLNTAEISWYAFKCILDYLGFI